MKPRGRHTPGRWLYLVLAAAMGSGCGDETPTSPGSDEQECSGYWDTDYSWELFVEGYSDQPFREVMIIGNDYTPDDQTTVSLKIDAESVILEHHPSTNWWTGYRSLTPGRVYEFALKAGGDEYETSLAIAFTPAVEFPETVSAGHAANVTWSLGGPARCQVAYAGSGDEQDEEDVHVELLDAGARSYTFPAGCVPGWGDGGTHLILMIMNRTMSVDGACLFVSEGQAWAEYPDKRWRQGVLTNALRTAARDRATAILDPSGS